MNDSLFWLLLILRYMHILGAIALMGGTIFMRFALAPTVASLDEKTRQNIHDQVRGRWAKFVMIAAALLLISGIANMILIPMNYELSGVVNNKQYNMIVGIKFILALPIFLFASFLAGRSATAKKFQANAPLWMNVNLALALVMVLIGGYLKFAQRTPKSEAAKEPAVVTARP
ncbi:MAG TPA: hypothetical protein VFB96_07465 [Pirellulaceae bacterium]|nr:hypothetical protein [Pirellulaceae bacterium]